MADGWPPAADPRARAALAQLDDLDALAELAALGVHDPELQPFMVAWTDAPPDERALSTLQYHWSRWASWKPTDWVMELAEREFIVRDSSHGPFILGGEQAVFAITYDQQGPTKTFLKTEKGEVIGSPEQPFTQSTEDQFYPLINAMRELTNTMYIGPFRNAINIGAQSSYYDIQTGDAFIRTFAGFKSGPNPADNEAVYELLQEIRRIFGFKSLDINPTDDYKVLQLTVDGRSYRLAEQGAGLAHFVVVLVNVLVRRPSLLLIDEPELNLHASLQLDFLETLAKYTRHSVVFATHSLGLARTALIESTAWQSRWVGRALCGHTRLTAN